jgi:hypothetical protein
MAQLYFVLPGRINKSPELPLRKIMVASALLRSHNSILPLRKKNEDR